MKKISTIVRHMRPIPEQYVIMTLEENEDGLLSMPQRIVKMRSDRDESLLYMATKLGLVRAVEALLERKAPIKTTFGKRKETVFHAAKRRKNKAVLRALLSNSRSKYAIGMVNFKGRVYQNARKLSRPRRRQQNQPEKKPKRYGKLVERLEPIPRQWVVAMADEDILTLRNIPDRWVKQRSYSDESLLYIAVRLGKTKSVKELLRHRAPIITTYGSKKETPIHAAARKKSRIDILHKLQENSRHKRASKIVDHKGRTYGDVLRIVNRRSNPAAYKDEPTPSMSDSTALNQGSNNNNNTASSGPSSGRQSSSSGRQSSSSGRQSSSSGRQSSSSGRPATSNAASSS